MGVSHIAPFTVSIKTTTSTPNETGGFDETFATLLTDVKVDIADIEGESVVREPGSSEETEYQMMSDTELSLDDFVVWEGADWKIIRKQPMYMYKRLHHYTYRIRRTKL